MQIRVLKYFSIQKVGVLFSNFLTVHIILLKRGQKCWYLQQKKIKIQIGVLGCERQLESRCFSKLTAFYPPKESLALLALTIFELFQDIRSREQGATDGECQKDCRKRSEALMAWSRRAQISKYFLFLLS